MIGISIEIAIKDYGFQKGIPVEAPCNNLLVARELRRVIGITIVQICIKNLINSSHTKEITNRSRGFKSAEDLR